jgi:hypothetical protein
MPFQESITNIDIGAYLENTPHPRLLARIQVDEAHLPLLTTMRRLDHPPQHICHHGMKQMPMQGETHCPSSKVRYRWFHRRLVTWLVQGISTIFIIIKTKSLHKDEEVRPSLGAPS